MCCRALQKAFWDCVTVRLFVTFARKSIIIERREAHLQMNIIGSGAQAGTGIHRFWLPLSAAALILYIPLSRSMFVLSYCNNRRIPLAVEDEVRAGFFSGSDKSGSCMDLSRREIERPREHSLACRSSHLSESTRSSQTQVPPSARLQEYRSNFGSIAYAASGRIRG